MPTVVAPDGATWNIRRAWVPHLRGDSLWHRFRHRVRGLARSSRDLADADPGCLELLGEGLVAGLVVIVVVLALVLVFIPLLVAVIELVALLVLALVATLLRIALRRPWIVEAVSDRGDRMAWQVAGWRASGERCREVAQLLEAGVAPQ